MTSPFKKGYITHISGRNGIGKTTLLKQTATYLTSQGQSVSFLGHEHGLLASQNVQSQLSFYQSILGHEMTPWIDFLEDISFDKYIFELSTGQQQRLAIACHLDFSKDAWLLDEPFDTLDSDGALMLQAAFIRFIAEDKILVLVDHTFDLRSSLHKYSHHRPLS